MPTPGAQWPCKQTRGKQNKVGASRSPRLARLPPDLLVQGRWAAPVAMVPQRRGSSLRSLGSARGGGRSQGGESVSCPGLRGFRLQGKGRLSWSPAAGLWEVTGAGLGVLGLGCRGPDLGTACLGKNVAGGGGRVRRASAGPPRRHCLRGGRGDHGDRARAICLGWQLNHPHPRGARGSRPGQPQVWTPQSAPALLALGGHSPQRSPVTCLPGGRTSLLSPPGWAAWAGCRARWGSSARAPSRDATVPLETRG